MNIPRISTARISIPKITTVDEIIMRNSYNKLDYSPDTTTPSDKAWAKDYRSITKLNVLTTINKRSIWESDFSTMLPFYDDDYTRLQEIAYQPNPRSWILESKQDVENWWHAEVSGPTLAAWARYPNVVQMSHAKPTDGSKVPEAVDCLYRMDLGSTKAALVVGQIRRSTIIRREWLNGTLKDSGQKALSRELRGFADKYHCPQVFCFDGRTLLLLQFRASKPEGVRDKSCKVDCWVISREDSSCTLRYALYRFMVQGLRRCQIHQAPNINVGGLMQHDREYYTGRPIWKFDTLLHLRHPRGYYRIADEHTGALGWTHADAQGIIVWETGPCWNLESWASSS